MDQQVADEDLIAEIRVCSDPVARAKLANDLFERHYSKVAVWCLRFTGNRETARDLAQEVFLKVYRSLDTYQSAAKFSTWLYVIVRNHCFNATRKRVLERTEPEDPQVLDEWESGGETAPERLEREASAQLIRTLLRDTLDETERRVMTLHYAEEIPLAAIGRLLRLDNPSGAKAYIVSAKRKLSRAIHRHRAREARRSSESA